MNRHPLTTTGRYGVPGGAPSTPPAAPSSAEMVEIRRLGECFRGHHIFWSAADGRGVRYMAYGATIEVRPHTIITTELSELREELRRGQEHR